MVSFRRDRDRVILIYTPEFPEGAEWTTNKLNKGKDITIKKTFKFSPKQLLEIKPPELDEDDPFSNEEYETAYFLYAEADDEYFRIVKGVLTDQIQIYISKEIDFDTKLFVADSDISIFNTIASLTKEDIYIGGEHPNALSKIAFEELIKKFPTTHEKKLYAKSRVATILRHYINNIRDAENAYNRYMDKKVSATGINLIQMFQESEVFKYETILDKLKYMLDHEKDYLERQWQIEILEIILLIYPKYINVFQNVSIFVPNAHDRYLDYLLVDSNGHIDIIEIKKPFDHCIVTESGYRNNHVPLRELSGAIMQIEKYFVFL